MRTRRRTTGLLTAGLLGAAVVTGCGGQEIRGQAEPADAAVSGVPEPSPGGVPADVADLSAGLLPAEAFGADAQVTPLPVDQLEQQLAGGALGGLGGAAAAEDLTVTPEECRPVFDSTTGGVSDLAGLTGFAAQTAASPSSVTVQMLLAGQVEQSSPDELAELVARCPQATVEVPGSGTVQAAFTGLDVPDLGDGAAGLEMLMTVPVPGGAEASVPLLLGVAQDGDRGLVLFSSSLTGGPSDPAAFVQLLEQAFEQQATALD